MEDFFLASEIEKDQVLYTPDPDKAFNFLGVDVITEIYSYARNVGINLDNYVPEVIAKIPLNAKQTWFDVIFIKDGETVDPVMLNFSVIGKEEDWHVRHSYSLRQ